MGIDLKSLREIHNLGPTTREWVVAAERAVRPGVKQARFTGYTEAGPGFRFVRHDPKFAMILIAECGEGRVWIDGEWEPCRAGFAYLTAPGLPHAYHIRPGGQRWRVHWTIYHDESLLPQLERGAKPRLAQVEATAFRHAVEGLCHEDKTRGDRAVMGLWTALVDRSTLRLLEADQADVRLDRLWLAIREDIGGHWSLRRMARYVGLSPESLRRLCQQHLKRSPMAQCTRLRMQAAADHLRFSEEKLEAVAARFGYADAFAFSTAFRRVWGVPPSRYRQG
jgi:AraC-like DNA-binding protein/quercetin dioxygenase-like cupin family protein